jgi:hypothetical protein
LNALIRQPVYGNFRFYPGTVGRIFLNDLPIFQGYVGNGFSQNSRILHFLVPEENRLELEILAAPKPKGGRLAYEPDPRPQMQGEDTNQSIEITIFKERAPESGEIDVLYHCMFPDLWKDVPEERRRLPHVHVATFDPRVIVPKLAFLSAARHQVPCEGTAELHQALRDLHDAFQSRDAGRLADEMGLQMAEFETAYDGASGSSLTAQREALDELVGEPIVVEPLDRAQIHFHARAQGRVVHVERVDRRPVIDVKTIGKPQGHASDPVFTHHQGRWRLM